MVVVVVVVVVVVRLHMTILRSRSRCGRDESDVHFGGRHSRPMGETVMTRNT